MQLKTKDLTNYLLDLAHENDVPGGHQLEDADSAKLRSCAERLAAQDALIEQQAKQIEKQTVLIEALDADRKYLRGLIRDVFIELEEDDNNGPGHDHTRRGVWDGDNKSGIAGKPCEWCNLWDMVRIEALK